MDRDPRAQARAYVDRQLGRCKAEFLRQQKSEGLTINALSRRRFAPSNATISRLFAEPQQQTPDLETVVALAAALGVQLQGDDDVDFVNDRQPDYGGDGPLRALVERLGAMSARDRRAVYTFLGLEDRRDSR